MARTPRNDWLDRPILCNESGPFNTVRAVHVGWCQQLKALESLVRRTNPADGPWVQKMLICATGGGHPCGQTWFCPRCWTGRAIKFLNAMHPHRPYAAQHSVWCLADEMQDAAARAAIFSKLHERIARQRGDRLSTVVYHVAPDASGCKLGATLFMKGRMDRTLVELAEYLHYPEALLDVDPARLLSVREFTRGHHSHAHYGNGKKGLIHDSTVAGPSEAEPA